MPNAFLQQRLVHLDSLAAELRHRGLTSRKVGATAPVLWVWHPGSLRQTVVFATPAMDGWFFLWSPDGQQDAADPAHTAEMISRLLDPADGLAGDGPPDSPGAPGGDGPEDGHAGPA
ncbi:hypothetical protein FHS43_003502 [Streptosporangium becharense]|uniref:Uncharacterized protein n=1 Tax=Streptosporangium becharense TaxID=1816182 RepID=A0A7W9IEP9_9ACTN|nr:hypothetical protein [Streptosporangium becharense]MBB2912222.1 hypothetical protein [Streptosporangium becharense]MBB5818769.1 hypothetical protein [Streptosporangium becharense]